MQVLQRKPNCGYLDNWLWVPKGHVDSEGVKNALSMKFVDSYAEEKVRYVYLFQETQSHLLVPRCLWSPGSLPFRIVDSRPRSYHVTGITSRIKLDHRRIDGKLVPTGEDVQQRAMDALMAGDSGILQLGCGKGKGQPLWETVYTPTGPTQMKYIEPGQLVLGSDGKPTRVLGVFPQGVQPCYSISFSDGTSVCCDENHLWKVRYNRRDNVVISTKELVSRPLKNAAGLLYAVQYAAPADFYGKEIHIDPWVLGAWLGDGSCATTPKLHNPEPDLQEKFIQQLPGDDVGYVQTFANRCPEVRVQGGFLKQMLEFYGLVGKTSETKFIPKDYLKATIEQRWELLRGLLDTDGSVRRESDCRAIEYVSVSQQLAEDVVELVQSLGGRATMITRMTSYTYKGEKKKGKQSYRLHITFPAGGVMPVSSRKHRDIWNPSAGQRRYKYITAITPIAPQPTICIKVDAPDQCYLTSNYTVTHNTVVALEFITRMQGPALIVLDNTNLLEQWRKSIEELLDVPGGVGLIQAGTFDWKKNIVLATYHTLGAMARELPEEVRSWFKVIVFDEGHHISASTFAPCAEVFYGYRLALTATPIRSDGLHVIYDNHIGPVLYKDVTHVVKPRIIFKWTGIGVGPTSPVYDTNGKVHLSKVSSHFGKLPQRLGMLLHDVDQAVSVGRKVLVLCNSVDECVNLCAMWTMRNWHQPNGTLYTDIPIPTANDVGGRLPPVDLNDRELVLKDIESYENAIEKELYPGHMIDEARRRLADCRIKIEQDDVYKRVASELNKRQKRYRDWLLENLTTAGLMIHKVEAEERMSYIKTKRVVFAITKYGKEGLDDEWLDTVLVSTPFADRNGLQQLIGRPTRQKQGKKYPLIVIYEDDIGPIIGMCKKLRHHLHTWPADESGPFDFELHNHPRAIGHSYRPIFEHTA